MVSNPGVHSNEELHAPPGRQGDRDLPGVVPDRETGNGWPDPISAKASSGRIQYTAPRQGQRLPDNGEGST
ncbi:MAG: hypothetical protein GY761_00070 [Hyphomicrobiales bacterium]|nr:hypothetical protein [Hyphomicrobiales bacterium]